MNPKLNKKCPDYNVCKAENEKLEDIWQFGCEGAKPDTCLRYEERRYALLNHERPSGEHQEQV